MKPTTKFMVAPSTSKPTEDADGVLTPFGMDIAEKYAQLWIEGSRDLVLEREHEELAGLFYDIRVDSDLARRHATPAYAEPEIVKSEAVPEWMTGMPVAVDFKGMKKSLDEFLDDELG